MTSYRTLDTTIRRRWPLPLAIGWGRVLVSHHPEERLNRLIAFNEILLRYLSVVALVDYLTGPPVDWKGDRETPESLLERLSRPTDGIWQRLLASLVAALSERPQDAFIRPLHEWAGSTGKDGMSRIEQLNRLVHLRNRARHDSPPSNPEQAQVRSDMFEELMRDLLQSMTWMTGYRLCRVTRVRTTEAADEYDGSIELFLGSDEVPEQIDCRWTGWLAEGSIYLLAPDGDAALLLSPFIEYLAYDSGSESRLHLFRKWGTQSGDLGLVDDRSGNLVWHRPSIDGQPVRFRELIECRSAVTAGRIVKLADIKGRLSADSTVTSFYGSVIGGRYEVVSELGRGGMSTVYRALDRVLSDEVALKVLHPDISTDSTLRERFRREARIMRRLRHPHVLAIHEFGQTDDGRLYMVSPISSGGTLADAIGIEKLNEETVTAWLTQITSALATVHDAGIVHRDIKPQNLLLDEHGQVLLADFGIAWSESDGHLTQTRDRIGSVAYMSPEQQRGHRATSASDVFSLGVVCHELLTGERPKGEVGAGIDGDLGVLVRSMGSIQPSDRPNAREILTALGGTVMAASAVVSLGTALAPPRAMSGRWWVLLVVVTLALVGMTVLVSRAVLINHVAPSTDPVGVLNPTALVIDQAGEDPVSAYRAVVAEYGRGDWQVYREGFSREPGEWYAREEIPFQAVANREGSFGETGSQYRVDRLSFLQSDDAGEAILLEDGRLLRDNGTCQTHSKVIVMGMEASRWRIRGEMSVEWRRCSTRIRARIGRLHRSLCGSIRDNQVGLEWYLVGIEVDFASAASQASRIEACCGAQRAPKERYRWALPTQDELAGLVTAGADVLRQHFDVETEPWLVWTDTGIPFDLATGRSVEPQAEAAERADLLVVRRRNGASGAGE